MKDDYTAYSDHESLLVQAQALHHQLTEYRHHKRLLAELDGYAGAEYHRRLMADARRKYLRRRSGK